MDMVDWVNPMKEEAEELAKQEEMEVWEVSAKTGQKINEMFVSTVAHLANEEGRENEAEAEKIVAKLSALKERRNCCSI